MCTIRGCWCWGAEQAVMQGCVGWDAAMMQDVMQQWCSSSDATAVSSDAAGVYVPKVHMWDTLELVINCANQLELVRDWLVLTVVLVLYKRLVSCILDN